MIRFFDILFSLLGLVLGFPLLVLIYILALSDSRSPLFRQQRIGRDRSPFMLVKFRTMKVDTESVATHLASATSVTKLGSFLRKTKLDELPQLWNVLKGDMSLVGPRPNLLNQTELIIERSALDVYAVRPGITGLAQLSGIDMSTPRDLANIDAKMIKEMSLKSYFSMIFKTLGGGGIGDRIRN